MLYQYKGEDARVTVAGITFEKGVDIELADDEVKQLKASGFGQAFLNNGSLVEVEKKAVKATATKTAATPKASAETITAETKAE